MQTDPAGYVTGLNLYEYVKSDPLNWRDELGLDGENIIDMAKNIARQADVAIKEKQAEWSQKARDCVQPLKERLAPFMWEHSGEFSVWERRARRLLEPNRQKCPPSKTDRRYPNQDNPPSHYNPDRLPIFQPFRDVDPNPGGSVDSVTTRC